MAGEKPANRHDDEARDALVAAAHELVHSDLTRATSGNLSARAARGAGFWVSASGCSLGTATPGDLVLVPFDGASPPTEGGVGSPRPSSEWRIHRDVYLARPDVAAIVHVHPPFATTIACLRRDLPAIHYEIAFAGGHDVRCADYATFGTEELSIAALRALVGRNACLLANHGMIAVGATLEAAMHLAHVVETVAELYWRALQIGEPVILDEEEIERVVAKFSSYGPNARKPTA